MALSKGAHQAVFHNLYVIEAASIRIQELVGMVTGQPGVRDGDGCVVAKVVLDEIMDHAIAVKIGALRIARTV
jgi:hypothetical protein